MEKTKHDQVPTSVINRTLININQSSDNINNDNCKSRRDSCVIDSQKPTCSKYTMPWMCDSKNETGFSSQTPGQERNDNTKGGLSSNESIETYTLTPLTTVTSDVEVSSPDCIVEISQILNADELVIEHEEQIINEKTPELIETRFDQVKSPVKLVPYLPDIEIDQIVDNSTDEILWGNMPYHMLLNIVNTMYDEIVTYRRNLFKVPSGKSGKTLIEELTFWLRQFNMSSKLNSIALKMLSLLNRVPSVPYVPACPACLTCPTCPRALRALRARVPYVPYVPYVPNVPK